MKKTWTQSYDQTYTVPRVVRFDWLFEFLKPIRMLTISVASLCKENCWDFIMLTTSVTRWLDYFSILGHL